MLKSTLRGCGAINGQKHQLRQAQITGTPRPTLSSRKLLVRKNGNKVVLRTAAPFVDTATEAPEQQAAAPSASHTPEPQEQQHHESNTFSWTKQWWPVAPVSYLDPKKPLPVTMLGHTYVVWFDPKAAHWRVMEDRCSHRLAPLSEGRIDEDGTLMCSYHGWQFSGTGACTRIPQIGDPEKMKAACTAPRACVATFPTTVADGVLYAWLESGPQAEAEAAAQQPYVMPELAGSDAEWAMTEQPVDYTFWLEQGMDPTHANFLHHTCGFPMSDALAMPGEMMSPKDMDIPGGYLWKHGNYSKKHAGMQAERQFVPPNNLRVVYDQGFVREFATMGVPVRPGVSRVFGRFQFALAPGKKKPFIFELMGKLPHWVLFSSPLGDQDMVVNAKQEAYMRSHGLTTKDYAAFARADQGVLAAHRWFDAAGYEQMWQQRLGSSSSSSSTGDASGVGARYAYKPFTPPKSEADYFNIYERHTKHCAECRAGLKLVEQLANAAAVAALLLVIAAASFVVAAKAVLSPGVVVCGLLGAGAVWLREKLLDIRQTRFISTQHRWQKDGGLSLVKGDPIKLY